MRVTAAGWKVWSSERGDDLALSPIAEIVHDIDLKDSRFQRHETLGITG
jgi:hypothetical protein